jgi:Uma2 family endonuclease
MLAAREHLPRLTPQEYFAWEQQQEIKHEYFDGEVFAMSGGTVNHGRISGVN